MVTRASCMFIKDHRKGTCYLVVQVEAEGGSSVIAMPGREILCKFTYILSMQRMQSVVTEGVVCRAANGDCLG